MKVTEQQHNERKREMMEKCFECYAENGLTSTGIKALAAACVHYAMFEDEYYLKSQMEILKQGVALFADKYCLQINTVYST